MGKILVTLQDRMNPQKFTTKSVDNKFRCPKCKSWITIEFIQFQGTEMPKGVQECKNCGQAIVL